MERPCRPFTSTNSEPSVLDRDSGCANAEASPVTTGILLLCTLSFLVYLLRSEAVRTFLDECQRLVPKLFA